MPSLRNVLGLFSSFGSMAVSAVAVGAIVWASATSGPGNADLAAVQENGCSVIAGNGKVVTQPAASCPVSIALSGPLSRPDDAVAPNVAPGDVVHRLLDITNDGKNTLGSIVMKAAATGDLDDDGLRLSVARCSVAWTATTTGAYTCSGATTSLLSAGELPQPGLDLGASPAKAKKGVDRLLVSLQLLGSVGNAAQGDSTTMTYTFTATKN